MGEWRIVEGSWGRLAVNDGMGPVLVPLPYGASNGEAAVIKGNEVWIPDDSGSNEMHVCNLDNPSSPQWRKEFA